MPQGHLRSIYRHAHALGLSEYDAKPRGYGSINFNKVCFSGCRVCAGRPIPNDRVAEPTKVEGVIAKRSGGEMIVEYMQAAELAFLLETARRCRSR